MRRRGRRFGRNIQLICLGCKRLLGLGSELASGKRYFVGGMVEHEKRVSHKYGEVLETKTLQFIKYDCSYKDLLSL